MLCYVSVFVLSSSDRWALFSILVTNYNCIVCFIDQLASSLFNKWIEKWISVMLMSCLFCFCSLIGLVLFRNHQSTSYGHWRHITEVMDASVWWWKCCNVTTLILRFIDFLIYDRFIFLLWAVWRKEQNNPLLFVFCDFFFYLNPCLSDPEKTVT